MYSRQIRTSLDNQKQDAASRCGMTEFLGCLVSRVWSVAKRRRFTLWSSRDLSFDPVEGRAHDLGRRTKDVFYPLPSVQRSAKSGSCPACADLLFSRLLVSAVNLSVTHFLGRSFQQTGSCSWTTDGGRL